MTYMVSTNSIAQPFVQVDTAGAEVVPATGTQIGSVTETAPTTDTASSGLNGRLQRIAQRLTSLINGATSTYRLLASAATTNGVNISATAASVRHVTGYNASGSARYLKFYNKATGPTVGTDVPRKTVYLPPLSAFALDYDDYYATGIGIAITALAADADATAIAANDIICLNVDYQ